MDAYISYPSTLTCLGNDSELWQALINGESGLTKAKYAYPDWFEESDSFVGVLPNLSPARSRLLQILERMGESIIPAQINNCELLLGASSLGDLEGEFSGDPFGCMRSFLKVKFPQIEAKFKGVVSSACSSGTDVLSLAAMLVDQKKYDVIGVLAVDCLEPGKLLQHFALGTQADDRARPFDVNRSGTSFGEGGGFAIVTNKRGLEKLDPSMSFQILGYGMSCDAMNITAPDETGEIPSLALKRALTNANCKAEDIGYVNAHASGTLLNDAVEALALKKAFKQELSNIPVSGTKGAVGHLLGATGLIEAIVACWSTEYGLAPGTVGLKTLDETLKLAVVPQGQSVKTKSPIAMSTTFGFGGVNSSIIVANSHLNLGKGVN